VHCDEGLEKAKEAEKDLYSVVEQINSFLDQAKIKTGVETSDFFPVYGKVYCFSNEVSSSEELTLQKRYRLKKHVTNLGKKLGENLDNHYG